VEFFTVSLIFNRNSFKDAGALKDLGMTPSEEESGGITTKECNHQEIIMDWVFTLQAKPATCHLKDILQFNHCFLSGP